MLHRDRIFLISLSILSSAGYAGDVPKEQFTTEFDNPKPVKPAQMPGAEFKRPHVTGGNGKSNSSSDVGSSTGGSILNVAKVLLSPSAKELARDREIEDLNRQLTRAMTPTGIKQIGGMPQQDDTYSIESLTRAAQQPVTNPLFAGPNLISGKQVASPIVNPVVAPAVSAPTPAPAVTIPIVPTAPSAAIVGKSPFIVLNRDKVPTLNELSPPLSYAKPVPTPQPVNSAPSSTYIPTPTSSDSFQWGKLIQDAGEGAAIAVGALAIGYAAYKTSEGVYKGGRWLWRKAFGEAEKQVVQQAIPKSVHTNLEFHQNAGHCETPPKIKKKPGCLRSEAQPGDPRTRGLGDIEFPTDATHIFRDQWGHFVNDTPETRNLLRECYKKGTYHGFDGAGNHQFSMTNPKDGTQLWLKMREGGRISTAGCNEIHLPLSKETGFIFKPDCWNNPSAKGVGCTFIGGSLATMSSQFAKANVPEVILFPVDKEPNVPDLNFFPFYHETYKDRYRPDFVQELGMPAAPEGYSFELVKNEGLLLPSAPKAVTVDEVKEERAKQMSYAVRMKKKNMEDYIVMEEMRKRGKQQAKALKNTFFKKDNL